MHKLKDQLKEKIKRLRLDKSPGEGSQADSHVDDEAGHSALAAVASGSEGRSLEPSSVPDGKIEVQQDLWQLAFAMLSDEERNSLLVLAKTGQPDTQPPDDISSIVPSLIAITRQKQEECEKRFWRIGIPGKPGNEIILRDQAAQIISWLTKAGDIGTSFAPSLVRQIWPCLKAILEVPISEVDQMAALLQVAEKVTRATARGRVYEACYTAANTPADALKLLQDALVALYKATFMLLSKAAGLLDTNILKRTVYSILRPDALKKEAGSDFADLETRLARDVQAVEAVRSAAIDGDLLHRLEDLDAPIVRIDERVASMLEKVEAEEEQKILDWISSVPYSGHHDTVVESRIDDTCGWLLRHSKFQEWENSSGCSLMWLQGTTGTGKTFLTSKVIDHKQSVLGAAPNDEALAFFYFSRTDPSRNSALSCLQSLVRQLSTPRIQQGHIRSSLRKLYNECRRGGRILSRELCRRQLLDSSNVFPRTTIIVDALDECNQDDRGNLIEVLDELMRTSGRPLMIFISGRPEGDIRAALQNRTIVVIRVKDNHSDIAKFIKEKVQHHRRWDKFDETLKDKVMDTLLEKSHGMFRWAKLQLDQLLALSLPEDVDSRLGKLPQDLEAAYDEIYLSRDGYESKVIGRAVMWMLASMERVKSEVLLPVVRIDPVNYVDTVLKQRKSNADDSFHENAKYVSSKVDEDLLLDLCANLLTLDSYGEWQFCHASVSEYFEDNHFNRLQAHTHAAFVSLVLTIDVWDSIKSQQQLGVAKSLWPVYRGDISRRLHRLINYANESWGEHVTVVEKLLGRECDKTGAKNEHTLATTDDLSAILCRFLGHPNKSSAVYRYWLEYMRDHCQGPKDHWSSLALDGYASVTMVRFGIFKLLQSWWQVSPAVGEDGKSADDTNPNFLIDTTVRSETGWDLLAYACHFGRLSIVETLLTAGVKAGEQSEDEEFLFDKSYPLTVASEAGHVEICELLVERGGYDPNFPTDLRNPLYCAARRGHLGVLRYLLSAGADASSPIQLTKDEFYRSGSALVVAACNNDVDTLQILIKNGNADPKALLPKDYHLGSAAIAAAFGVSIDALKYLILEAHVDVNAEITTGLFESVLAAVVARWPSDKITEILPFLAQHGVNFNIRLREIHRSHFPRHIAKPGTMLEWAAIDGIRFESTSSLKVLVEKYKADVNYLSEDGPYGCALVAAQYHDLQSGAGSSWYSKQRRHKAALHISRWLVRKGADVNLQLPHGKYHSPLAAATVLPGRKIMEYLIGEGADVNLELEYGDYGSALAFAAAKGHLKSAQCLIDLGADVNLTLTHGLYRSALMAAAGTGEEDAVLFLIDNGANVNQPENLNWEEILRVGKELASDRKKLFRRSSSLSSLSFTSSSSSSLSFTSSSLSSSYYSLSPASDEQCHEAEEVQSEQDFDGANGRKLTTFESVPKFIRF